MKQWALKKGKRLVAGSVGYSKSACWKIASLMEFDNCIGYSVHDLKKLGYSVVRVEVKEIVE